MLDVALDQMPRIFQRRRLLASLDREKYGETKAVEMNFKDVDGDISKLSENATRGLLPILRKEAARQEAEEARAKLPGNQSKRCRPQ